MGWRFPRPSFSLRAQLFIHMALVLLPITAFTIYSGLQRRETDGEAAREQAIRLASDIGHDQEAAIQAAKELVGPLGILISAVPTLEGIEVEQCLAFFGPYVRDGSRYASALLADAGGSVICGSSPESVAFGRQPVVAAALASSEPVVGAPVLAPGGVAVLPVAQGLRNPVGQPLGAIIFNLDIGRVHLDRVSSLPDGAFVTVIDAEGTILARYPGLPDTVGRYVGDSPHVRRIIETGSGIYDTTSLDGEQVLVGYSPLDDARTAFVSVGLPKAEAYAAANSALQSNLIVLAIVALASLAFAFVGANHFFLRPLHRIQDAARAVEAGDLSARAGPNYGSGDIAALGRQFDSMADAISRDQRAIRELNTTLEQRVLERTAQLQEANRELEAFSYSVSHDLRAPLRAVDGFSDMLENKYRDQLPEDAQRLLSRIRAATHRMGDLIDDLLQLSRVTRTDLNLRDASLDAIVEEAIEDARAASPDRQIEWKTSPLGVAKVDSGLLRRVMANLVGNSMKFSRDRQPAVIEIGRTQRDNETVYYVRDNGVGFDQAHAGSMFGVFQRLHLQEEFEGTGVGLAIVDRIIRRHGGRVWAEGEPGVGATFYFTLNGSTES